MVVPIEEKERIEWMEGKGRNSIYSGSREAQVERQVKGKKVSGGTSKRVTEKEHYGRGTAISE